ncbi:hypothetical protein HGA92_05485 [Candidatus Gracilibacteria bacterium]|nr:hypothetical protein [Candidatus Gracilibacteria bacterium]NUJ98672.1 hypothetical protein [Candidatus Gracilibacteria bacterium]
MSQTIETQKIPPQISPITIETPEQLAQYMEKKNILLANKIRELIYEKTKNEITQDSLSQRSALQSELPNKKNIEAWEKLKKGLSQEDKKTIENSLDENNKKIVREKFQNNPILAGGKQVEEIIIPLSGAIGAQQIKTNLPPDISEKIQGKFIDWIGKKVEGWKQGWIDKFLNLKEKVDSGNGGFFGDFKLGFFEMILGMFKVDTKKLLNDKKKKIESEAKKNMSGEELKETEKKAKYVFASDMLIKYFGYQFKNNGIIEEISPAQEVSKNKFLASMKDLFIKDLFINRPISEIKNIYSLHRPPQKQEGIAKDLGINDIPDEVVYYGIALLVAQNSIGYKIIKTVYEEQGKTNLDNLTVKELILGIYDEISVGGDLLETIKNFHQNPQGFLDSLGGGIEVKKDNDGKIIMSGGLTDNKEKLAKLKISPNIIFFMLHEDKKIDDTKKNINETTYNLSKEEKETINTKIFPFGREIIKTIISEKCRIIENTVPLLEKIPLTTKEILELYITTGGETNFEKMSQIKKTYLITRIMGLILKRDESLAGTLGTKFLEGKLNVPKEVNEVLTQIGKNISIKAIKETFSTLGLGIKFFDNIAKENLGIAILMLLGLLGLPIFNSKKVSLLTRFGIK